MGGGARRPALPDSLVSRPAKKALLCLTSQSGKKASCKEVSFCDDRDQATQKKGQVNWVQPFKHLNSLKGFFVPGSGNKLGCNDFNKALKNNSGIHSGDYRLAGKHTAACGQNGRGSAGAGNSDTG
jgi:hypothetical protein